jgi:hypothetical protein
LLRRKPLREHHPIAKLLPALAGLLADLVQQALRKLLADAMAEEVWAEVVDE